VLLEDTLFALKTFEQESRNRPLLVSIV